MQAILDLQKLAEPDPEISFATSCSSSALSCCNSTEVGQFLIL
jgi:hypothetical protein